MTAPDALLREALERVVREFEEDVFRCPSLTTITMARAALAATPPASAAFNTTVEAAEALARLNGIEWKATPPASAGPTDEERAAFKRSEFEDAKRVLYHTPPASAERDR